MCEMATGAQVNTGYIFLRLVPNSGIVPGCSEIMPTSGYSEDSVWLVFLSPKTNRGPHIQHRSRSFLLGMWG